MPKIESENQFLTSIKGRNSVLICPAESENDALTDGRTDGRTEGRNYRTDILRFLLVRGHCKFMGLTSQG